MTRRLSIVVAALTIAAALPSSAARAQTTPPPTDGTPIVQLGIFTAPQPGGNGGGGAFSTSDRDASLRTDVYIMPCSFGASSRMPTLAYAAWHVEGQVVRQTPQDAVVRVTWRRTRAAGQPATGPSSTTDLTLTVGQHIVLDQEAMPALGECGPMSVTLEARYEPRMSFVAARGSARGQGFGGVGGGASSAASRGDAPSSGSGISTMTIRGSGGGTSGNSTIVSAAGRTGGTSPFIRQGELWLVHSAPNKDDEVLQASTIARPGGGDFAFAPVTIQTTTGTVAVRVTGTLELGMDVEGKPRFVFGATRRVTFTSSTRAPRDREASVDSGGVANTILPVPGPDEVLSFEMPPIDAPGVPALPDHFAIRVRLSPIVMRGGGSGAGQAGAQ